MTNSGATIVLSERDLKTLRLLSFTPLTAALILKGSSTFTLAEGEETYANERRVRERMQVMERAKLIRSARIIALPSLSRRIHGHAIRGCLLQQTWLFALVGVRQNTPT